MTYAVFFNGEPAGTGFTYPEAYTHAREMASDGPYRPRRILGSEDQYPELLTSGFESVHLYSRKVRDTVTIELEGK